MRQGADGPFVRIRHVAKEVGMESASLKSIKISISRTSLQERMRAAVFHEHMEDIRQCCTPPRTAASRCAECEASATW